MNFEIRMVVSDHWSGSGVALMCSQRKNGKSIIYLCSQFCAVNFSMFSNNICIILINLRQYVRCIPCGEFPDIVTLLRTKDNQ